jgi:hypothetical protein
MENQIGQLRNQLADSTSTVSDCSKLARLAGSWSQASSLDDADLLDEAKPITPEGSMA